MDRIRATVIRAWARLQQVDERRLSDERRRKDPPRAGRPRDPGKPPSSEEAAALGKPGFAEEALPWIDSVHRFARQLARDENAAEDLVQETYLRAFRSWEQFDRGTNCRAWLFTICRRTHLHEVERASSRYEMVASDVTVEGVESNAAFMDQHALATSAPDQFFDMIVDEALVAAIDALPADYREVLILSDLGDLKYAEISQVLQVPVGTVKSRLSRARRQVRDTLQRTATLQRNSDDRPAPILGLL